jgi:hypothetical protein
MMNSSSIKEGQLEDLQTQEAPQIYPSLTTGWISTWHINMNKQICNLYSMNPQSITNSNKEDIIVFSTPSVFKLLSRLTFELCLIIYLIKRIKNYHRFCHGFFY